MPISGYGVSGHGVSVAVEDIPVVSGTFVDVGGLNSNIDFGFTREWTKTTPHNYRVDGGVTSNNIARDEFSFEVNYEHGTDHDDILRDHFLANDTFGLRFRGPSGSAGNDEIIMSGELTSWKIMHPVDSGERKASMTFRASGPFIVDGTVYD